MRRVGTVLLCEDSQHEVFVRRFLKKRRLVTGRELPSACRLGISSTRPTASPGRR